MLHVTRHTKCRATCDVPRVTETIELWSAGDSRGLSGRSTLRRYSALQKGGDPAAGSPTATLLRLRPSHRVDLRRLRPCGSPTGFGSPRLPWRDGRCVQGPGTYSPRRGSPAVPTDSGFMKSS